MNNYFSTIAGSIKNCRHQTAFCRKVHNTLPHSSPPHGHGRRPRKDTKFLDNYKKGAFSVRFRQMEMPVLEDLITPQTVPLEKNHPQVEFDSVSSKLTRQFISSILDQFARNETIRELAEENNITGKIFDKAFQSFRLHCCYSQDHINSMEPALKILFNDIQNQNQSVHSIYPFFAAHAHKVYPHLECIKDLKRMSDITQPHNWYPAAREIHRKIVFHAGPTNSGKTYEALQVLKKAECGMYCGPLRLLAFEVYERLNKDGVPCDMITGERRHYAHGSLENLAAHCAYTVEMLNMEDHRDVCIIDEIQMLRDTMRGAAWTRALLGAAAKEIHLCGEESAIEIVEKLLDPIGEHVDVRRYKRKGDLIVRMHGLGDISNVQDGDCLIHFNKRDIFEMAKKLEVEQKRKSAIIFGDLPPETKREFIQQFNDPEDLHKVLISTDAIGMGVNLNIKRIIFTTLFDRTGQILPAYFVKQIAGRAGRFGSRHCVGEVMTFQNEDAKILARLMDEKISPIKKAGLAPTFDMIEMFSLLLPHCSLVQLLDIFISIATISNEFFVCMPPQMRDNALLIEHIPISLKDRWTFCLCPFNSTSGQMFMNSAYVKMIRRYSEGNAIPVDWIKAIVQPYMKPVDSVVALNQLIEVYEFLSCYLWLSYRFEDHFIHNMAVRELQTQCTDLINESMRLIMEKNVHATGNSVNVNRGAGEIKKDAPDNKDEKNPNKEDKSAGMNSDERKDVENAPVRTEKEDVRKQSHTTFDAMFSTLIDKLKKPPAKK